MCVSVSGQLTNQIRKKYFF